MGGKEKVQISESVEKQKFIMQASIVKMGNKMLRVLIQTKIFVK